MRIGVVVLFFGVSFLLKYAAEHSMLPIELRLIAVACGAIAMMVVGWKLRTREGQYGLVLQGGGVGLLYALIFAAAKYYTLFPLTGAFAMMFLVVMLGSLLAVLQNALSLALLASIGGYLAPILTSSGQSHRAVQLLPVTEYRHSGDRLVQSLAIIKPDQFCVHVYRCHRVGRVAL